MDNRPIGVFDSGLGGLSVVKDLQRILPGENIVYFGDTGRVPYGTRSAGTVKKYASQDEAFLLSFGVKMIIAACGTVSSVAVPEKGSLPVPFLGVVEPASLAAVGATKVGRIGVIGTSATIKSGSYKKAISAASPSAKVFQQSCPLFVPIVEEGFVRDDKIALLTAERYLKPLIQNQVDTLILGCTHYPLISDTIAKVMGGDVTLISAGQAAAEAARELLSDSDMLSEREGGGACDFFVSDRPQGFAKTAQLFLGEDISGLVKQIDIENIRLPL